MSLADFGKDFLSEDNLHNTKARRKAGLYANNTFFCFFC